jgi:hypothetical protein
MKKHNKKYKTQKYLKRLRIMSIKTICPKCGLSITEHNSLNRRCFPAILSKELKYYV